MSEHDPAIESEPLAAMNPSGPWRPWVGRGLWLAVMLVLGLTAWREMPREISRWYLAASQEHHADAAYAQIQRRGPEAEAQRERRDAALARALAWDPLNAGALLQRASWRVDQEPDKALADCERALRAGANPVVVHRRRSALYASMGRMKDALAEQVKVREQLIAQDFPAEELIHQLNEVAYMRAVSQTDLRQALKEINEALATLPQPDEPKLSDDDRDALVAFLDTRGYIRYLLNQPQEAIGDMDHSVKLLDDPRQRRLQIQLSIREPRDFDPAMRSLNNNCGVIYYHRALVLEKLGHRKEAARDRNLAKQFLGREPDESVY